MKKVIKIAALGLALVAAFCAPKVFAESARSGVSLPDDDPARELVIKRKVKNLGEPIEISMEYRLDANGTGNPGVIDGLPLNLYAEDQVLVPDENGNAEFELKVPLGQLKFSKVGYYIVNLNERLSSDEQLVPVDRTTFQIMFRAYNVLAADNTPTGELRVALEENAFNATTEEKLSVNEICFESEAQLTYIRIKSMVTGALAEVDRYFKYKLSFEGPIRFVGEASITVSGQDEEVVYGGQKIITENKYDAKSNDIVIYLKHGQEATIGLRKARDSNSELYELPIDISYAIEAVDGDDDSYATSIDDLATSRTEKATAAINAGSFSVDNITTINHNREAVVQTGVVLSTLPFVAVAITGIGGLVLFRRLSRS